MDIVSLLPRGSTSRPPHTQQKLSIFFASNINICLFPDTYSTNTEQKLMLQFLCFNCCYELRLHRLIGLWRRSEKVKKLKTFSTCVSLNCECGLCRFNRQYTTVCLNCEMKMDLKLQNQDPDVWHGKRFLNRVKYFQK